MGLLTKANLMELNKRLAFSDFIIKYKIEKIKLWFPSILTPNNSKNNANVWARPDEPPLTKSWSSPPGFKKQTTPKAKIKAERTDMTKAVP